MDFFIFSFVGVLEGEVLVVEDLDLLLVISAMKSVPLLLNVLVEGQCGERDSLCPIIMWKALSFQAQLHVSLSSNM